MFHLLKLKITMKYAKHLSLLLFVFMAALSSCFEVGDDILPTPIATTDKTYIVGAWEVYEIAITGERGYREPVKDAAVWINDDGTLTIRRKGEYHTGKWDMSKDGGYVGFILDNPNSAPDFPGNWSIQKADSDLLWLSTSIKNLRMRRMSDTQIEF